MKYIIFGCGTVGKQALYKLGYYRVQYFCDNYSHETEILGIPVLSFEQMTEKYATGDFIVVIATVKEKNIREIEEQLCNNGISRFFLYREEVYTQLKSEQNLKYYLYGLPLYLSYAQILSHYNISKYRNIAIYGESKYLPYLISETDIQCNGSSVKYLINAETQMGVPSVELDDITDKIDCLILNSARSESNIRSEITEYCSFDVIDLYDIDALIPAYHHPEMNRFKNIHAGERCFIIGNGPSLSMTDLDTLADNGEVCFGVNKIYLAFDKTKWRPNYFCVSDPMMIPICSDHLSEFPGIIFFADDYHWISNHKIEGVQYVHFKSEQYYPNFPGFSDDLTQYTCLGYTVLYDFCIQIAAFMGFSEIYLLGADNSFSGPVTGSGNHFSDDYYSSADKRTLVHDDKLYANLKLTTKAYEYAEIYSRKHGFRIYNATRGGELEVFERVDFDSLFS